jgi:hypothetical protein
MRFESFPQSKNEIEESSSPEEKHTENGRASGTENEHERFGWSDIIVPGSDVRVAEKVILEAGFECRTKVIPEYRQYLDNDERKQAFDEFVISITRSGDKEPVDRETLKAIMAALRENDQHVIVRVARIAPGEHFG